MKKPYEEWPSILYSADVQDCLDISRTDAATILKKAPVLDPSKLRYRAITKKDLIKFLEGEEK